MFDVQDYGPVDLEKSVVTLGNFDGFHRGHQALLSEVVARARRLDLPAVVYTLYPHPVQVLRPDLKVRMLEPPEKRIDRLLGVGVDHVVVIPFDVNMATVEPEDFLADLIVHRVHPAVFVAGPDTRFGRDRRGDVSLLRSFGLEHGFDVFQVAPFILDGARVSSSGLRQLVQQGKIEQVTQWLGRRFEISGVVERGDGRGASIGFPTANVPLGARLLPARGVYAVWCRIGADSKLLPGVANLGYRPTFESEAVDPRLEVHLFDPPASQLYGERIHVELVAHLRGEEKFASVEALRAQIERDVRAAGELLATAKICDS